MSGGRGRETGGVRGSGTLLFQRFPSAINGSRGTSHVGGDGRTGGVVSTDQRRHSGGTTTCAASLSYGVVNSFTSAHVFAPGHIHIQRASVTHSARRAERPFSRSTKLRLKSAPHQLVQYCDATSASLRRHFDVTSASLWRHCDVTSTSLRRHCDVTSAFLNFTTPWETG